VDISQQVFDIQIQIHQKVGFWQRFADYLEQLFVQAECIFRKVFAGKYEGLINEIVGDGKGFKQIAGGKLVLELFVAFGQKRQFQRESIFVGFLVKLGQKRVFFKLFQNEFGIVFFGNAGSERCFAGADVTFDGNKIVVGKGHETGLIYSGF
jgi:hypothetical protein